MTNNTEWFRKKAIFADYNGAQRDQIYQEKTVSPNGKIFKQQYISHSEGNMDYPLAGMQVDMSSDGNREIKILKRGELVESKDKKDLNESKQDLLDMGVEDDLLKDLLKSGVDYNPKDAKPKYRDDSDLPKSAKFFDLEEDNYSISSNDSGENESNFDYDYLESFDEEMDNLESAALMFQQAEDKAERESQLKQKAKEEMLAKFKQNLLAKVQEQKAKIEKEEANAKAHKQKINEKADAMKKNLGKHLKQQVEEKIKLNVQEKIKLEETIRKEVLSEISRLLHQYNFSSDDMKELLEKGFAQDSYNYDIALEGDVNPDHEIFVKS